MENKNKKRKVVNPPTTITTQKSQAFIMCGSYEKVLLGWNLNSEHTLNQTFLTVAHQGCIKAMAASNHLLATSSTDETVKLYNLAKKKELGVIQSDSGVVSCLQFYSTTHLFAGSENGNIYVWDTKTWELVSSLSGHKGGVISISVHPTGKMMLSLSKDGTFKLWDIIKGVCAYTSKAERDGEKILWSKEGSEYIIISSNKVDVFNAKDGSKISTIQLSKKILAATLLNKSLIAVGGEDQEISICDITNGTVKCAFKAHNNRIKAFELLNIEEEPVLVSISSDGYVKLWKLGDLSFNELPTLLTEVSTSARLTCVATALVTPSNSVKASKDKEEETEEVEHEQGEEEETEVKVEQPKQQKPKKKKKKVAFRSKS